jgi:DNA-binding NarL/FixJ family response regulator
MSDNRGIAGASFISSEKDRLYSKLKSETLGCLELSTKVFHGAVLSHRYNIEPFIQPLVDWFTHKEIGLLHGMAQGKSIAAIAGDLKTTPKYLEKVLRQIRRKMSGAGPYDVPGLNRDQVMRHLGKTDLLDHSKMIF